MSLIQSESAQVNTVVEIYCSNPFISNCNTLIYSIICKWIFQNGNDYEDTQVQALSDCPTGYKLKSNFNEICDEKTNCTDIRFV